MDRAHYIHSTIFSKSTRTSVIPRKPHENEIKTQKKTKIEIDIFILFIHGWIHFYCGDGNVQYITRHSLCYMAKYKHPHI